MTLEKAIEIVDRHFNLHFDVSRAELDEAAKLLIEAGKRTRDLRISGRDFHLEILSGETED